MPTLALVIPSVRQGHDLARALQSVQLQRNLITQVIVVLPPGVTPDFTDEGENPVLVVNASRVGVAAAMRMGIEHVHKDVTAFIDDDAVIGQGWAERLLEHYEDASVVGVGGRDIVGHIENRISPRSRLRPAGRIDIWGRVIGNHNASLVGPVRVDHLKGVNCSFRTSVIADDVSRHIVGSGAQARNEFVLSLCAGQFGHLIFDPNLTVFHYAAERAADDARGLAPGKAFEAVYNERIAFRLYRRKGSLKNLFFILLMGYKNAPGLLMGFKHGRLSHFPEVIRACRQSQSHS